MRTVSGAPQARRERARCALEGLSVGDAFGEQFFGLLGRHASPIEDRITSASPWYWTDDTTMAISLVEVLEQCDTLDQDLLARSFARRYDVKRAYGPAMNRLLRQIQAGQPWRSTAQSQFEGQGSYGNGAAMRVAPLGAYFADDLDLAVEQAQLSAAVTHTHPEGIAGAIAVAVAAALAWQAEPGEIQSSATLIDLVLPYVPASEVRSRMRRARDLRPEIHVLHAAVTLGSGGGISAQDTVPYTLWCAGRSPDDFEAAMWLTASGMGDIDTTCAIVGGIVAGVTGLPGIPDQWRASREPLPAF